MEKSLKDRKWKEFFFTEMFKIYSSSSGIDKNKLIMKKGKIPYVTRSEKNNGIDLFLCKQNVKYDTDISNVITIGLDTQTVFYQPNAFYTGQNIQILENQKMNKSIATFLIPLIRIQLEKFNWGGNGATLTRLKRSKIFIPITSKGKPDYAFMEAYMQEKEKRKRKEYKNYISKRIKDLEKTKKVTSLNEKKWKAFELDKMFKFIQGKSKGLNHLIKTNIGVNYLGATNLNNAVLCQVKEEPNLVQKGNSIAFIRNGEGSMGYSVYKAESFIATSDISVGYNPKLNRYIGTFITTVADKVRGKYNFGYKRSGKRLIKEKIMLPINKNNKPDYEYMNNYMKILELKKIKEYLNFIS